MTNLLTLAAQIEQATEGQQREMLMLAYDAKAPLPVNELVPLEDLWEALSAGEWRRNRFLQMLDAEAYESAAMMLVHPKAMWAIGSMEDGPFARLCWPQSNGGFIGGYHQGRGSTSALSLAAACCRAVAQMGEG